MSSDTCDDGARAMSFRVKKIIRSRMIFTVEEPAFLVALKGRSGCPRHVLPWLHRKAGSSTRATVRERTVALGRNDNVSNLK
jgi:hypothetical protein